MFRVFKKKADDTASAAAPEEDSSVEVATTEDVPAAETQSTVAPPEAVPDGASRRQSMDLFRSLLAGMYDAVLIVDDKGYLIQSNERAREFFRYSEADMWNINCSQLVPQLNLQVLYKIREHISQHRYTVVNAICNRSDGTSFPGEIAISSMMMNNSQTMVLSIRNVERRNKTMHINRMRDKVLKYAGVGMIACKPDGSIAYANPAFQKLVRATSMQDLLDCNISEFIKNDEQREYLLESPTKLSSWTGTIELTTMNGKKIMAQSTSARAEERSGKGTDHSMVMTFSLMPAAMVSAAKK